MGRLIVESSRLVPMLPQLLLVVFDILRPDAIDDLVLVSGGEVHCTPIERVGVHVTCKLRGKTRDANGTDFFRRKFFWSKNFFVES